MTRSLVLGSVLLASAGMAVAAYAADMPGWAYPLNPATPVIQTKDDGSPQHVPNSTVALTRKEIGARGTVPDWHPDEHPQMPDIVAKGREPAVRACGYCHQPSGAGRPENAALTGLTPGYIRQQVQNFKNGERVGSEPKRAPQTLMMGIAKALSDAEIEEAAKYFSSIKPVSFVKVVEAGTAPKTTVTGGMMARHPDGGTEPIGNRIIEVPDNTDVAELRDSRTTYTAFVPTGSIKKGETLVTTGGGGKTLQCTICHGPDLRGLGDVPRIAGRSPSYLVRQLYDIQNGKRGNAPLMNQVVAKLDNDDMVAIAAYVASREP